MHALRGLIATALAAGFVAPAFAQSEDTTGSTSIVDQYALTKNSDLAFGAVLPPTSGSNTVAINEASGVRSISGGGNGAIVGSAASRATYQVDGDGGQAFDINIPATVVITRQGGTETLTVALVPTITGGTLSGSTGSPGTADFGVGGNFAIAPSTQVGTYVGSFVITIENN